LPEGISVPKPSNNSLIVSCFHFMVEEQCDKCVLIYSALKLVFVVKSTDQFVWTIAAACILMLLPDLKLLEASSRNFVIFEFLCQFIYSSGLCKISDRGRWCWWRFMAVSLGGMLWTGFLFDVLLVLEQVHALKASLVSLLCSGLCSEVQCVDVQVHQRQHLVQ